MSNIENPPRLISSGGIAFYIKDYLQINSLSKYQVDANTYVHSSNTISVLISFSTSFSLY